MINCTVAIWPAVCSNIWIGIPDKEDIVCKFRIIRIVFQIPDEIYEKMDLKIIEPKTQFAVTWVNMVNKRMRSLLPLDIVLSDTDYLSEKNSNFSLGNVFFNGRYGFELTKYQPTIAGRAVDDDTPVLLPYPTDIKSIGSDCRIISRIKEVRHNYGRLGRDNQKEEIVYINQEDSTEYLENQQMDNRCMFLLFTRIYRMCLWLGWDRRTAILQYTDEQIKEEKNRYFKQERKFLDYIANYFNVQDNIELLEIAKNETKVAFAKHLFIYDLNL